MYEVSKLWNNEFNVMVRIKRRCCGNIGDGKFVFVGGLEIFWLKWYLRWI